MTKVLVSDTSVLIDLERGRLLVAAFQLSCAFAVPDLLYKRELREGSGPELMKLGLLVEELDEGGVAQAAIYRQQTPALSLPDAFALVVAQRSGFVLLTGDGALRSLAEQESIECHGVLWLLDMMNHEGAATAHALFEGLRTIATHPRCRLPRSEVRTRLKQWAAKAGIVLED